MRSFKNEDVYTPIPNANTSPLAVPAKPKKKSMGSAIMKKVTNELVYTKYVCQNGVCISACIFARIADSL